MFSDIPEAIANTRELSQRLRRSTHCIEDETGVSNAVIMPDVFERERVTLLENAYLVVEGEMQNIET